MVACGLFLASFAHASAETGPLSTQAMAECNAGRDAKERSVRLDHFKKGEELARQAVAANDKDANAHFAVFCNMGEAMRIDGESVQALVNLGSLMSELNRTIELDPNHADALAAKGTLLVRLPKLMGGDTPTGEAMLRKVLTLDEKAFTTRISLARVCQASSRHDEAVQLATRALEIARTENQPEKIAEAQKCLADFGVKAPQAQ